MYILYSWERRLFGKHIQEYTRNALYMHGARQGCFVLRQWIIVGDETWHAWLEAACLSGLQIASVAHTHIQADQPDRFETWVEYLVCSCILRRQSCCPSHHFTCTDISLLPDSSGVSSLWAVNGQTDGGQVPAPYCCVCAGDLPYTHTACTHLCLHLPLCDRPPPVPLCSCWEEHLTLWHATFSPSTPLSFTTCFSFAVVILLDFYFLFGRYFLWAFAFTAPILHKGKRQKPISQWYTTLTLKPSDPPLLLLPLPSPPSSPPFLSLSFSLSRGQAGSGKSLHHLHILVYQTLTDCWPCPLLPLFPTYPPQSSLIKPYTACILTLTQNNTVKLHKSTRTTFM